VLAAGLRRVAIAAVLASAAALVACGGDDSDPSDDGAEQPAATSPASDPGAAEPSPEAAPEVPESGGGEPLGEDDRAAVETAARAYVGALNDLDGAAVCELAVPGAIPLGELPKRRGGCASSMEASLGTRPARGGPAWKRTTVQAVTAVSAGEDAARVTATVRHDFSDRSFFSIEEDVIYLERRGDRWLLAKPSASFYRAVGYPEPPLRALTPP